ncbi:UNVERIFIED_CONTAM: hypothetical protein FKN15_002352 [Acipenser sinensis]
MGGDPGVCSIWSERCGHSSRTIRPILSGMCFTCANVLSLWENGCMTICSRLSTDRRPNITGGGWLRTFQLGDKVLLLLPSSESKLLAKRQGPYEVGTVDHEICQPERWREKHIYHVNLLKPWLQQEALLVVQADDITDLRPDLSVLAKKGLVQIADNLTPTQKCQACVLVAEFPDVFSPVPGQTRVAGGVSSPEAVLHT